MNIKITINEQENGDVAVHIKREAGHSTDREMRYANALTLSIKEHLAGAMPQIVNRILADEKKNN